MHFENLQYYGKRFWLNIVEKLRDGDHLTICSKASHKKNEQDRYLEEYLLACFKIKKNKDEERSSQFEKVDRD